MPRKDKMGISKVGFIDLFSLISSLWKIVTYIFMCGCVYIYSIFIFSPSPLPKNPEDFWNKGSHPQKSASLSGSWGLPGVVPNAWCRWQKAIVVFFNLFVSGMSCTAQIRRKKEKSMFSLKQIIVKFIVWKLSLGNVMGFAHLFLS